VKFSYRTILFSIIGTFIQLKWNSIRSLIRKEGELLPLSGIFLKQGNISWAILIKLVKMETMKSNIEKNGKIKLVPLSQEDLEILIYMMSDVWITPELKRFKNEILDGLEEKDHF
jgi:hypothetical protein